MKDLLATGAATRHELEDVERAAIDEVEAEAEAALRSRETAMPRGPEALAGVYAP